MAWGSKGRSALTTAGTADSWGITAGAGTGDGWGITAGGGTAGIGAGIEMGLVMGCGFCILAGNGGGGGGGLFSSISILLDGTAGTCCSLAKSISILKLGDTMLGLTGAGMNLSCSASM